MRGPAGIGGTAAFGLAAGVAAARRPVARLAAARGLSIALAVRPTLLRLVAGLAALEAEDTADLQARKFQRELTAGLTSLVLLSVLAEAGDDLYGYEIARRLSGEPARGPFKLGALYPVLRNLSAAGLLSSRVVPSHAGPPRRYYRITPLGREALATWRGTWAATRDFVDTILNRAAAQETSP